MIFNKAEDKIIALTDNSEYRRVFIVTSLTGSLLLSVEFNAYTYLDNFGQGNILVDSSDAIYFSYRNILD